MENDSLAASLKEASMFTGQWDHQVGPCSSEHKVELFRCSSFFLGPQIKNVISVQSLHTQ